MLVTSTTGVAVAVGVSVAGGGDAELQAVIKLNVAVKKRLIVVRDSFIVLLRV
jgi:hypothetical protein